MNTWKNFLSSYFFIFLSCAAVAWDINPANWTDTMRLLWVMLGFIVFAMVQGERKRDEQ